MRVIAIQYKQSIPASATYASIDGYLDCYFTAYVAPYARSGEPVLVAFNELTGLAFGLEGSRGALARAFAATPLATQLGAATGAPLGALGGAVGLVGASYAGPLAFYVLRFPAVYAVALAHDAVVAAGGGVQLPAQFVFLALTDTYVRTFVQTFSTLARRYRVTVVAGAALPVLTSSSACAAAGYRGWVACPGWRVSRNPLAVTLLSDPDLAKRPGPVYEALTPTVTNAAFFFAPDGRLYDIQPKVNLTATELELGWQPAPPSTIHAIALYDRRLRRVRGVRLGVAISLDAFEHGTGPEPCAKAAAYLACLAAQHVNLLLQPEFNDGTAECASWSDYQKACRTVPVWQPLEWMFSSWYDLEARLSDGRFLYPSFRYAVNPFMVGNLFDITGDGQTAIFARRDRRAHRGAYVGDSSGGLYARAGPFGPYPDPTSIDPLGSPLAPRSLRALDGSKPGFLAALPWVLPAAVLVRDRPSLAAGDPRSLESCTDGLVAGSGVRGGPCAENAYMPGAIIADLRLP